MCLRSLPWKNVKVAIIKHVRIVMWNVLIHASYSSRISALTACAEFKCSGAEMVLPDRPRKVQPAGFRTVHATLSEELINQRLPYSLCLQISCCFKEESHKLWKSELNEKSVS